MAPNARRIIFSIRPSKTATAVAKSEVRIGVEAEASTPTQVSTILRFCQPTLQQPKQDSPLLVLVTFVPVICDR
jgi:hypothetical protein